MEQGYEAPFEDSVFVNADIGCEQIRNLLNTNCALGLSGEERKEIYICRIIGLSYAGTWYKCPF